MKIPRALSGKDLVDLLCRGWDYRIVHQEGSHIVLETDSPLLIAWRCPHIRVCGLEL